MIQLIPAEESHIPFVYECLTELRGEAEYTVEDFATYMEQEKYFAGSPFQLFVALSDGTPVGILTCNRFAMPRYLGFGAEIEEVVVHPNFQNRGMASAMLKSYLDECAQDSTLRKVTIKTDDPLRAGRVYSKYFLPVDTTVYSKTINRL